MSRGQKRVAVIGLGRFGEHLARTLAKHCEVLAIDSDQAAVDEIADAVHRAVCLDAREWEALSSVVTADFDEAVVALGGSMEVSILCVLHLTKIKVPVIHAKATSRDHAEILRSLGAKHLIHPERESAERLANHIVNPNLLEYIPLKDDYVVAEVAPPVEWFGRTLAELEVRARHGVLVLVVNHVAPEGTLFLPGPGYVVRDDDALMVVGRESSVAALKSQDAGSKPKASGGA